MSPFPTHHQLLLLLLLILQLLLVSTPPTAAKTANPKTVLAQMETTLGPLLGGPVPTSSSAAPCTSPALAFALLQPRDTHSAGTTANLLRCTLALLNSNPKQATPWAQLGHVLEQHADPKAAALAEKAFATAHALGRSTSANTLNNLLTTSTLPTPTASPPSAWWFLGPFPASKMEVDGDPAVSAQSSDPLRHGFRETVPSELQAEPVQWTSLPASAVTPTADGTRVAVGLHINWNELVQTLTSMAVLQWQGWAVTAFVLPRQTRVLVSCPGIRRFRLDNLPLAGDVYNRPQQTAHELAPGVHVLAVQLRAKGPQAVFQCSVQPMPSQMPAWAATAEPAMLPDLLDGHLVTGHVALRVTNFHPHKHARDLDVTVTDASRPYTISLDRTLPSGLAPVQTLVLPLVLARSPTSAASAVPADSCPPPPIPIKLTSRTGGFKPIEVALQLRCRRAASETFLLSFLDRDGSVQQAAAIAPRKPCANSEDGCPILLSFHGTGVSAQSQADSYKRAARSGGDFVFGHDALWVLAPSRHGAHNWEGIASNTALAAVDALVAVARRSADVFGPARLARANRLIVAGHSMGGHGAWLFSVTQPQHLMAMLPAAGWLSKEEYGEENAFFKHDIGKTYIEPATKALVESCFAENNADTFAANVLGVPILARVGASDRTVHPFFQRKMARVLHAAGGAAQLQTVELPGKEHWWWDTVKTSDGGTMFDQEIRKFLKEQLKSADASVPVPDAFVLELMNPASFSGRAGIRVQQLSTPFRMARIEVARRGAGGGPDTAVLELQTHNVRRFSVCRGLGSVFANDVHLDGQQLEVERVEDCAYFFRSTTTEQWMASDRWDEGEDDERRPATYGPARRVGEGAFVIVVPAAQAESYLPLANFLSTQFLLTSDSTAPIVLDSDLTAEVAGQHNLIVLGAPTINSWAGVGPGNASALFPPVVFSPAAGDAEGCSADAAEAECAEGTGSPGFLVGTCRYMQPGHAVLFVHPHPVNGARLAMTLAGNSLASLQTLIEGLATPTIPPMARAPFSNGVPDFVVTGPRFAARGLGGAECLGFWGNAWEWLPATAAPCVGCA